MIRERPPAPMARRVAATDPITPALVAAASGVEQGAAERYMATWFDAVARLCREGKVLVFDDMVIGRPEPLLLEAWYEVRAAARAEAHGVFDDVIDLWYDEHAADDELDDEVAPERPTIVEWAIAHLRPGWQGHRVVNGNAVSALAGRDTPLERWVDAVRLMRAIERLVVELADAIEIDGAAVIDARLWGQRIVGLRWAA